jgi:hypothetical protein
VNQDAKISDEKQETTYPSFSMPKYILLLILPKCSIVEGEVISSVYFQIAVNINHKKDTKKWLEEKSWIGTKTISKITNYNFRTITNAINVLSELNLIEQSYHGKLKMFSLKNNDLIEPQEIFNFVSTVEQKLLKRVKEEKILSVRQKFSKLNSIFNLSLNSTSLGKKFWFEDINHFRDLILKAESTYKGSSLFFVNLLWENIVNKKSRNANDIITENDRSLMIGCSQSTLNRYILAYEKAGIIYRKKIENSKASKIILNFNNSNNVKIIQKVVNQMNGQLYCPICNIEFETPRSLSMHISKSKDLNHQKLIELKKEHNFNAYQLIEYYVKNNVNLDKLELNKENNNKNVEKKQKQQKTDNYMSIPCECTMTCHSCYKNWKNDYFDDCEHPRKAAYIEEYFIEKENNKDKEKVNKTKQQDTGFDIVPTLKTRSKDTAPALVSYFYELTGTKSPNWSKESRQVKNLLTHNKLTPDQVRTVLSYMARKNHVDLRFLSGSINDAFLEKKYIEEMDKEGTAAFLLKRYYTGLNLAVNMQNLIREVSKIQETMNSGLSYEETKIVIDYMIATKCPTINFISSKRTEALSNKNLSNNVTSNSKNTLKNNPSFYDQDDITLIKDELSGGRTDLEKIKKSHPEIYETIKEAARQILIDGKYNQKFNGFEWAWKIKLPLDKVTYEYACKDMDKETYLSTLIENFKKVDNAKYELLKNNVQVKFNLWLDEQHKMFSEKSQNY